jgi:NADPH:quinone reductase-like Zn-dependent oxidoreductase
VLGCEIAGTIEEVGSDVRDFQGGDPVYGYVSLQRNGGYAEYTIAKPDEIAPKRESLDLTMQHRSQLASLLHGRRFLTQRISKPATES